VIHLKVFCRQTLSLRLLSTLRRRFYHPLPQNLDNLKQIGQVSISMENTRESPLSKVWYWWRDLDPICPESRGSFL